MAEVASSGLWRGHLVTELKPLGAWYEGADAVRKHGLYAETKAFVANVLALKQRM